MHNMSAHIPADNGIPRAVIITEVDGESVEIPVIYINDDYIVVGNDVTTYDTVKKLFDDIKKCSFIKSVPVGSIELTQDQMESLMSNIGKLRMNTTMPVEEITAKKVYYNNEDPAADNSYVSSKDELEYDDLCTLEALISLFDVPDSILLEISQLKEAALLTAYEEMQQKLHYMESQHPAGIPTVMDGD